MISSMNLAIKNNKLYCKVPYTLFNYRILDILLKEGYLYSITILKERDYLISVKLKYYHNKNVLRYLKQLSKPGDKTYWSYKKLKLFSSYNNKQKLIISTNKGIMTSEQALNDHLGGEVLFELS